MPLPEGVTRSNILERRETPVHTGEPRYLSVG